MRTRAELLTLLRAGQCPDVLIVGGGINGVGAFRDLAAQGHAALLVESGDFASGTSSAPSRLIHGGLRYLETGEAALVRESLTERNLLLKNAGHLVHPLPVWVPLNSWLKGSIMAVARFLGLTRTPGPKGGLPVILGLMLYDRFGAAHQTMPNHSLLFAKRARDRMPLLSPNLRAVAQYYDARITHPERLVVELVRDAETDCPASMAIPYVAAGKMHDGAMELTDTITGEVFAVRPRLVVNAAGAWVDGVQENLGFEDPMIGGTRGSHLVIKNAELAHALIDTMLYFETADHRACLIYPMGGDRLLLGTTDLRSDNPNDKTCTDAEIDYLFDALTDVLPAIRLTRDDIVFAYAGVRPLPLSKPGATGAISRDHKLMTFGATQDRPFPLITLIGGKWTTYRVCGEQIADAVMGQLGLTRHKSTQDLAIGGGKNFPRGSAQRLQFCQTMATDSGLDLARCTILAERYGADAVDFTMTDPTEIAGVTGYGRGEIALLCRQERVSKLQDIVLRRSLMCFEGALTAQGVTELAKLMADIFGWNQDRTAAELAETLGLLRGRHRMMM